MSSVVILPCNMRPNNNTPFIFAPGNNTLWLSFIIFPRWQHFVYIIRPVRRAFNGSIPFISRWQHPITLAYNIPPIAVFCLYRTPRTTCPQWQHSPYNIRPVRRSPNSNILFVSALRRSPGNNTFITFVLRRSPGNSTFFVAYAPYDIF